MSNNERRSGLSILKWPITMLVIGFMFILPGTAEAQTVTGSGTTNQIPKFTGASVIGNSVITDNAGNVGIGTTTPGGKLDVAGMILASGTSGGFAAAARGGTGALQQWYNLSGTDMRLWNSANGDVFTILNSGSVGIGTITPSYKLHVNGGRQYISPTAENYALGLSRSDIGGAAFWLGASNTMFDPDLILSRNSGVELVRVTASGKMGIGTSAPTSQLHVVGDVTLTGSGNITASGTISGFNVIAKYQDVAEWVPASRAITAGTVVVLDTTQSNHVLPSSRSYDTRVAGVVSASPGVILGEGGQGKVMVATTGRVRIKVDATNGPVHVGDLLVTSDKEGFAMRSVPLDLGGTPIHRPGTLIGKALEPLDKGVGEILVLLSLQ